MKKWIRIILLSFILVGCVKPTSEPVILDDSTFPYEIVEDNNMKVSIRSIKDKDDSIEIKLLYENNTGNTVVIVPGSITVESGETAILPVKTNHIEDTYEFTCVVFDMKDYDGMASEDGTLEVDGDSIQLEKLVEYHGSVISKDDKFELK